jgi:multicomponent Na+:H+ antiporter subunit D
MTIVPLTVLVPLIGAAGIAALRPVTPRIAADWAALLTAVAVLVLCLILVARAGDGTIVYWWGAWTPRPGGVALGVDFAFGPLGAAMAAFAAALSVVGIVLGWRMLEGVDHLYHAVKLVFLAAMVGFALSGDLFNMFVFFELMSVAAYVLAGFKIDKRAPLEGSLNFAITNSVGAILVLFGIGLVYGRTGALNLAQIGVQLSRHAPDGLVVVGFALIVCGFLVKAAAVPFHFWLADAYSVAPTPVCILFAGAMSELGLLGVARVYWTAFEPALGAHSEALRWTLLAIGLVTAFVGGAMALAQHHLKRMLAFVTVAYVGLFLVGVALLSADGLAGTAVFVVGDGLAKAALFACVGIVQHRKASIDEVDLHGRCRDLPITGAVFTIAALAVAGLPPFGPFLGKALVEDAALKVPGMEWVPAAMLLASALAAGALLRAAGRIFLGLGEPGQTDESSDEAKVEAEPESDEAHDHTPTLIWAPAVILLVLGLAWGLVPGLAHDALAAATRFAQPHVYASDVLRGTRTPLPPVPDLRPAAGSYLYGAGAVLMSLVVAAAGIARVRAVDRVRPGFAKLRALHSGHVGDYVAWLTTGVAVIGTTFAVTLR